MSSTQSATNDTYRLVPLSEREDSEFAAFAQQLGWLAQGDAWMNADSNTAIKLIHDPEIGIRYLTIKGTKARDIWSTIEADDKWFCPREAILTAPYAAETVEEAISAIHHVGVTAPPEYDDDYFDLFEAFVDHPDETVRLETLVAMAYPGWPELRELAKFVRDSDPEPGVREAAEGFLAYDGQ